MLCDGVSRVGATVAAVVFTKRQGAADVCLGLGESFPQCVMRSREFGGTLPSPVQTHPRRVAHVCAC